MDREILGVVTNSYPYQSPIAQYFFFDAYKRVNKTASERLKDFVKWVLSIRINIKSNSELLQKHKYIHKPHKN